MEEVSLKLGYCNSLTYYSRYVTREVMIGNVGIGGNNPIRVQSMTTTDTMDTIATVEQSIRMIKAGCELVRITAPSMNEARNLENIKNELHKRGYKAPLVADIHFTPNAAELAARIVEKVRVNPGNYVDKKKFENIEYTDGSYLEELERIRNRFTPLVKICKEYGTVLRIGTNHGSLSDRIMSRYGDTPLGMVESAMEFLRICEENNYYSIVLSMKSSNPQVMVQAYRLLIVKMQDEGMNYPLHLGVTEAGEGEDGRIKSAVGIGTLLEDGIGDTIRVSLTEEPEYEIPVAKTIVERYARREQLQKPIEAVPHPSPVTRHSSLPFYSPFEYQKRITDEVVNIGSHNVPRVIADLSDLEKITHASLFGCGYNYSVKLDKWNLSDQACDYVYAGDKIIDFEIPGTLGLIYNSEVWKSRTCGTDRERAYPLFCGEEFFTTNKKSDVLNFVVVDAMTLIQNSKFKIQNSKNVVLIFETSNEHGMAEQRRMFFELMSNNSNVPVIIKRNYIGLDEDTFRLYASTDAGALFIDGFGDGIWLKAHPPPKGGILQGANPSEGSALKSPSFGGVGVAVVNSTSFGILQATRTRISKTEYISCPSCGRTLFDLQETTARIRSRTDHLKGVKIGIMGCIVNGPGEMADADYGYVGVGVGKITLYKGKEVVQRSIDADKAVDALIDLIKQHGDWVERIIV